jgi:hypothetical protein
VRIGYGEDPDNGAFVGRRRENLAVIVQNYAGQGRPVCLDNIDSFQLDGVEQ